MQCQNGVEGEERVVTDTKHRFNHFLLAGPWYIFEAVQPVRDMLDTPALGDLAQLNRGNADVASVSGRDVAVAVERPLVQSSSCRVSEHHANHLGHNRTGNGTVVTTHTAPSACTAGTALGDCLVALAREHDAVWIVTGDGVVHWEEQHF